MKRPDAFLFLEPRGAALEIVRAAKARGLKVISLYCDEGSRVGAPEAYGKYFECIDVFHKIENWTEDKYWQQAWEEIKTQENVVGLYTGADVCVEISAKISQELKLPSTLPEVWSLVVDKYRLRKKLLENNLSTLKTIHSNEVDSLKTWPFKKSAFFKPIKGANSLFVKRCENLDDIQKAKEEFFDRSSKNSGFFCNYIQASQEFHVEEAIDGELMSVEAISQNGHFRSLGVLSRILFSEDTTVEMGSCFPYPHPLQDKIIDFVKRVHETLEITNGATHTEIIVSPEGQIEIIDLNPRFVGADVIQSVNNSFQIDIAEKLVDLGMGKKIDLSAQATRFSCLQYVIPPSSITFESISFPHDNDVIFSNRFLKPGTTIGDASRQIDYAGCYLVSGNEFKATVSRAIELRKDVLINKTLKGRY